MATSNLWPWLIILGGYLLGSILPADWFIRRRTGQNALELDENPGSTGTLRQVGLLPAIIVFLFDFVKGLLPVVLADKTGMTGWWLVAAAVAPVVGHNWPFWKRFHGGKGLATALGALTWLGWPIIVITYPIAAVAALWSRWAPMIGVVVFPLGLVLMWWAGVPTDHLVAAVALMLVVFVRQLPWIWRRLRKADSA